MPFVIKHYLNFNCIRDNIIADVNEGIIQVQEEWEFFLKGELRIG